MPRRFDKKKRGFALMESRRVNELVVDLKPSVRTKSEADGKTVYTLTVEVTVGKHDRSAIISAFRHLGVWFEDTVSPEEATTRLDASHKTRNKETMVAA